MFQRKTKSEEERDGCCGAGGEGCCFRKAALSSELYLECVKHNSIVGPLRLLLPLPGMNSFRYLHQLFSHFTQGPDHPVWRVTFHHSVSPPALQVPFTIWPWTLRRLKEILWWILCYLNSHYLYFEILELKRFKNISCCLIWTSESVPK